MLKQITSNLSDRLKHKKVVKENREYHEIRLSPSSEELLLEKEKKEIDRYSDFLSEFGDNFEQKTAVISDSKRILVLAGAGSGKTKVLSKRFIHLVNNKGIHQDEVLALTFSNNAAEEMRQRIAKDLDTKPDNLRGNVKTFHSFCWSILKEHKQFTMITEEEEQREIIQRIIDEFRDNEEVMQCMNDYIKNNILWDVKDRYNLVSKEPQIKNKPDAFGERRINTIKNVLVRSKSERDIANFLTLIGINWEYERPAEWMKYVDNNGKEHIPKPDFYLPDYDVYIEHWGYSDKTYIEHRKLKKEQFKRHKKNLISVDENEMLDLIKLQRRLKTEIETYTKNKLEVKRLTFLDLEVADNENKPVFPEYKESYDRFVDEIVEIINLAKSRLLNADQVEDTANDEKKEKVVNFYKVLVPVMREYEIKLAKTDFGLKDFNDLMKDAIQLLKTNPKRRDYYLNNYSHILVDEFQDVSFGQIELLNLLVDKSTSLFVVGDDWQSIYGWRGSDVKYILNFGNIFKDENGFYEKIILPINYRSAKNIVEASTYFIQLSKNQYKKDIRCCKENESNDSKIIQVNLAQDKDGVDYIIKTIEDLKTQDPSLSYSNFLILHRSSRTTILFRKEFKERNFPIKIRTIHWSKGMESDYVFVLGLKRGTYGFPNVYADKDIKQVIMEIPIEDKKEEERRLFYVAMTRARKKLFLISQKGNESEFVRDIPSDYKDVYSEQNLEFISS